MMMDMVTFFSFYFRGGRDSKGEGDEVIVVFTFIAIEFLFYFRNYHFTYCLLISKTVVTTLGNAN